MGYVLQFSCKPAKQTISVIDVNKKFSNDCFRKIPVQEDISKYKHSDYSYSDSSLKHAPSSTGEPAEVGLIIVSMNQHSILGSVLYIYIYIYIYIYPSQGSARS